MRLGSYRQLSNTCAICYYSLINSAISLFSTEYCNIFVSEANIICFNFEQMNTENSDHAG